MSRDLPARPNLEFLKKQAKKLLQTLERQNPHAQLSDAQHALARFLRLQRRRRIRFHEAVVRRAHRAW